MSDAFRKCDGCGSIVPVRETDPPSGFVRWEPVDARALSARLSALEEVAEAIERIAEQQPKTLATLRHHGIVFDGPLGNDPKNWQHVAFSIYTDLCEVDTIARAALAGLGADTQESGV